jgi:hypothetical protein
MKDLKQYLDELAGPDHPFTRGVSVAGLMVESKEAGDPSEALSAATRQALVELLRLN